MLHAHENHRLEELYLRSGAAAKTQCGVYCFSVDFFFVVCLTLYFSHDVRSTLLVVDIRSVRAASIRRI